MKIIHENIPFSISVVTYIELVQGMRKAGMVMVNIIQINSDISTRAMLYVEECFLSRSMGLADSLIAATCVNYSNILLTANDNMKAENKSRILSRNSPAIYCRESE
jgi:predicted nucleic acid-binding protein